MCTMNINMKTHVRRCVQSDSCENKLQECSQAEKTAAVIREDLRLRHTNVARKWADCLNYSPNSSDHLTKLYFIRLFFLQRLIWSLCTFHPRRPETNTLCFWSVSADAIECCYCFACFAFYGGFTVFSFRNDLPFLPSLTSFPALHLKGFLDVS